MRAMRTMPRALRRGLIFAGWAVIAVLVASCVSPPPITGVTGEPAFERRGRFALLVEYSDGKQDSVQGGFAWRDAPSGARLDLANPLGSTLARIDIQPGQALLTRSDGSKSLASNPDELVEQVLGSPIPVVGLRHWLRGQLAPGPVEHAEKDSTGHLLRFAQHGWRVELTGYDGQGPGVLRLRRTEAGRDIRLRLVIDKNS